MKQKDIITIIAVAIVAGIFSIVITNMLFSTKKLDSKVEKVDAISSQFNIDTDKTVFNDNAINPTQLIQIGSENNSNPF